SSDPLDGEDSGELLTWLNFHREDFERAGEAFVFMVSSKHADAWSKSAPDLDRYTQHFELVDWYDLVVAAERAAELTSDTGDLEVPAQLVERRLERFRGSNRRIPVALLATHVHDLLAIGA